MNDRTERFSAEGRRIGAGRKRTALFLALSLAFLCAGCGGAAGEAPEQTPAETQTPDSPSASDVRAEAAGEQTDETGGSDMEKTLRLAIGETEVSVTWEDNESVAALKELVKEAPRTVPMSMYGGFEQVGSLGTSLPRNDRQTTTEAGDIVLYAGNQLVLFYGSNSWAYTRLGRIADKSAPELKELLGGGDVTVSLTWE